MADDITTVFVKELDTPDYQTALDIMKRNSNGRLWLIGGFVYGTLANKLHDSPKPPGQFVFVVEKPVFDYSLPPGWKFTMSEGYWNPKFIHDKKTIDYVPLENLYPILRKKLPLTIDNYLSGVALTVQSIVFDIDGGKILGDVGIRAIRQKIVAVNDEGFAKYTAWKKYISVEDLVRKKADELGFTPVYQN